MAVIDETWKFVRGAEYAELLTVDHQRGICDWGDESTPPDDEDGKLLASVPELLRKIRDLEQELAEARDG